MQLLALLALAASGFALWVSWDEAQAVAHDEQAFELPVRGRPIGAAPGPEATSASAGGTAGTQPEVAPREVVGPDGFVDLEHFTFPGYDPPELRPDAQPLGAEAFPEAVAGLDGREVGLEGYMIVTDYEDRALKSFLLSRFPPGCCFGAMPVADEWVLVRLAGAGIDSVSPYQTLAVRGKLEVGESLDEDGYLQSLYRLKDARVEPR